MSCDVCIGTTEDFGTESYHVTRPRSRKPVTCCECRRTLPVGTVYVNTVGKWEGEFQTYRQCVECSEIQEVFACGEGFYFTQLWEDFRECQVFENLTTRSRCLWQLSPAARAFLTQKWWEWKTSI